MPTMKFTATLPDGYVATRSSKTMEYVVAIVKVERYADIRRSHEASIADWERRIAKGSYDGDQVILDRVNKYIAGHRESLAALPTEGLTYYVKSWSTSLATAQKRQKADEILIAAERVK